LTNNEVKNERYTTDKQTDSQTDRLNRLVIAKNGDVKKERKNDILSLN
jgi:hypothetical protein